jgi:hypothetical protein
MSGLFRTKRARERLGWSVYVVAFITVLGALAGWDGALFAVGALIIGGLALFVALRFVKWQQAGDDT